MPSSGTGTAIPYQQTKFKALSALAHLFSSSLFGNGGDTYATQSELGNDTSASAGLGAPIRYSNGSSLVGELVELELSLVAHFLREGGVACNVLEGSTDEFVGLDGLAGGHVAEDSGVRSDWHADLCCKV